MKPVPLYGRCSQTGIGPGNEIGGTKRGRAALAKASEKTRLKSSVHGAGGGPRQAQVYGVLRCMISSLDLIDGRGPGFPRPAKNFGPFFPPQNMLPGGMFR